MKSSDRASALDKKTVLVVLCLASACGPAGPAPRSGPTQPPAPRLIVGEPSPVTITATRDFSFVPAGDALADLCSTAAARAPLHYSSRVDPKEAEAARNRRGREFERWVQTLQRSAKLSAPAQVAKLHKQQGTVLGHSLSTEVFAAFRAAPAGLLTDRFAAMSGGAIGPFLLSARTPAEDAFKGDKVLVRVEAGRVGKATELEIAPDAVKELREVRAELERLAAAGDGKLPLAVQRELVQIALAGVSPTLTYDAARSRAARLEAIEQAKKVRMTFSRGEVVLKKGEIYTLSHRHLLETMHSEQCQPCTGGLTRCAPGQMRLLRVGSISYSPIMVTRSFQVTAAAGQPGSAKQGAETAPRVFVCDEKAGQVRVATLKRVWDLAQAAQGGARWEKLRDGLKKELQVEVILPLLQSFERAPAEKLRGAILELYARSQSSPLTASKPLPQPGEACVLRRLAKDKTGEETKGDCTVVPLARFRLELPDRVAREPGLLSSLPPAARKAAVELVQELLVANTTFDAAATARQGKAAGPQAPTAPAATAERSFKEGAVLVEAGKRLSADDIYLLEQMFSISCVRVVGSASSQR